MLGSDLGRSEVEGSIQHTERIERLIRVIQMVYERSLKENWEVYKNLHLYCGA